MSSYGAAVNMSTLTSDLQLAFDEANEAIVEVREILAEFDSEDVRVMARRASEELTRLRLMETATVQGLRRQVNDLEQRLAYANSGQHGDCQG